MSRIIHKSKLYIGYVSAMLYSLSSTQAGQQNAAKKSHKLGRIPSVSTAKNIIGFTVI